MLEDSPLLEAIALWESLTGVSPPDEKGFWSSGGGSGTWQIRDTYTALKEALELDPSEITATLLFKRFLEEYLRSASTSMMEMLTDPERSMQQLVTAKKLLAIVDRPEIVEAREAFIAGLTRGLAAYGADARPDVQAVLDKPQDIAILRRDALRSLEKLRVDQFLEGETEGPDYTPVYVNEVHLWWNINSLLKAMTHMPSGVSLNLIRDPNAYESYFAFAIRNGGNLFVLTDVPEHAHPLQSTMTRKPGRDFDRRAAKNWFPYDLLGMQIDDKGDSVKPQHSDETAVVIYQPDTIPMIKLGEIPPHECIWVTMMLDLIVRKFWRRGFKAKELSYTGEMIKLENTLLIEAARAGLPAVLDRALEMPALTLADVTGDAVDPQQVGKIYDRPNQWLEDRYKHLVTEESLNLLAGPGEVRKLVAQASADQASMIRKLGEKEDDDHDENGQRIWSTDRSNLALRQTQLVTMSGTKFGTPAELEADRRFLARYNVAKQVALHAGREFEDRKAEVLKWYEKRVRANMTELLKWTNNDELWLSSGVFGGFSRLESVGSYRAVETDIPAIGEGNFPGDKKQRIVYEFIRKIDLTRKSDGMDYHARWGGVQLGGFRSDRGGFRTCVLDGTRASMEFVFYPTTPEHLAILAGCKVSDLPDVLQNWNQMDPYRGNCILDRIDPMVWKVSDPWRKMDLRVRTPLSILGHRKVQKMGAATPPGLQFVPLDVVYGDRRKRAAELDAAISGKKVDADE